MSQNIPKSRLRAFNRQQGRCFYCKMPMWIRRRAQFANKHKLTDSEATRFQCTAEHLTARRDGGNNAQENIVAACRFCNITRHRRPTPLRFDAYQALVQRRLMQAKWHPKQCHHMLE